MLQVRRCNRQKLTIGFLRQVVSALKALHENGLVHHDLKFDNIVLSAALAYLIWKGARRGMHLVDFGYSNMTGSAHPRVGCTYGYAPREVLSGEHDEVISDPAADV